jgi:hypothetical protein
VAGRYFAFVSACVNGTSGGAGGCGGSGRKVNGLSMNTSKAANWIRSRRLGFQMRLI